MIPSNQTVFYSGRWNTTSNPDLAFANLMCPLPHRIILDAFPRSQHRPSLISPENPVEPIHSKPIKRWNFREAKWDQFTTLVDLGFDSLPSPTSSDLDHAYSALCSLFIRSAQSAIPRSFRHRYIPTWDEESELHYNDFLQAEPGERAATKTSALTNCLDQKHRKRWEETV